MAWFLLVLLVWVWFSMQVVSITSTLPLEVVRWLLHSRAANTIGYQKRLENLIQISRQIVAIIACGNDSLEDTISRLQVPIKYLNAVLAKASAAMCSPGCQKRG